MPDPVTVEKTDAPALRMSDNPAIVDAVQKDLDAFGDVDDGTSSRTVETPAAPESEQATKADDAGGLAGDDDQPPVAGELDDATQEKLGLKEAAEPATDAGASTLPAAYRRSAKAREWTDAEIDGFYKQNPELAIKTFEKMHQSRVSEVEQWAELGRKAKASQPAPAAAPAAPVDPLAALKPIDVKAMAEKFGNEDLIAELAGPMNAAIQALQPLVKDAMAARQVAQQTQQDTLAKAIGDFFTGADMKPYSEVYGGAWDSLTPKQNETRNRVLEVADALIAGAQMQGRSVNVAEALALAHDSVSSQFKERVIRDRIRQSVTQRGKGLTLRPSSRGASESGGPPKNKAEMEQRAADRLRSVFG